MARGRMQRRTFLKLSAATAAASATSVVVPGPAKAAAGASGRFRHGVASGDPLPDGVVLWTRVTPSDDATPGSGIGAPTAVRWEIARDATFAEVVASGEAVTSAASDHTVKVDATGLPSATELWYRFEAGTERSPVGRTRTAPAAGSAPDSLRVGVVSCSNWVRGHFSAYRHLADRDDLDLVVHLGDYLYESGNRANSDSARSHDPAVEITVLEAYRRRHAQYKTDPDLQRLHQRFAWVTTIDDHEVTNDAWRDGAENHQAPDEGDYAERRAQSLQAYFEWMPLRATGGAGEPSRVYRSLAFGGLAELFMLDERTYRDQQVAGVRDQLLVTSPAVGDPSRTLLGPEQRRWLVDGLTSSRARWKLVGNPVMFAPLVLADLPDPASPLGAILGTALGLTPPIVLNSDQWDGYRAEQAAMAGAFGASGGVVIVTGDIHSSWGAEIPADPGTYLPGVGGDTVAVEFVTPAVTSNSFSTAFADAGVPAGQELGQLVPTVATTAGPWFKYVDAEQHGFGVLDLSRDHAQFQWFYVSDRADPQATVAAGPSLRSPAGSNRLLPADALPARPPAAAGPPPPAAAPAPPAPAAAPPDGAGRRLPATGGTGPVVTAAAALVASLLARAGLRRSDEGT